MKESREERYKRIHAVRKKAKVVTYSAMYGVGKSKLSRTTGMPEKEAAALIEAFWEINWAVKEVAAKVEIRKIKGQMWVKNPVSSFWHSLRYERDVWSTLNQSTGVYCFDTWVAYYLTKRPDLRGQFHDETINAVPKGEEKVHEKVLQWAIGKVNDKLKLNVDLGVDVQFGANYSEIH